MTSLLLLGELLLFFNTPPNLIAEISLFGDSLAGAFFACPFAGYVADRYGRRWCILVGALIFMLGASLQTGAQNIGK